MGLRPCDFEMMTPAEFYYAFVGYMSRERQAARDAWERTRWEAWVLTSVQLERKDRRSLTEMFPMPWDGEDTESLAAPPREMTLEERRQRAQEIIAQCTPTQE